MTDPRPLSTALHSGASPAECWEAMKANMNTTPAKPGDLDNVKTIGLSFPRPAKLPADFASLVSEHWYSWTDHEVTARDVARVTERYRETCDDCRLLGLSDSSCVDAAVGDVVQANAESAAIDAAEEVGLEMQRDP